LSAQKKVVRKGWPTTKGREKIRDPPGWEKRRWVRPKKGIDAEGTQKGNGSLFSKENRDEGDYQIQGVRVYGEKGREIANAGAEKYFRM